jgi:hypothetical protein
MDKIIRIGEEVEHGGQRFVVVDIKHQATMDGVVLQVVGYDPEMANKQQHKAIKVEQTQEQIIDMLKRLTGEGGIGGIHIGGMQ